MAKEYIEREATIEWIMQLHCDDCNDKRKYGYAVCRSCGVYAAINIIEDAPAADVAEVVRCKDCKYRSPKYDEPDGYYGCDLKLLAIDLDCFCSEGERRENER